MILAYSRYLYVRFYPRQTLEFFLEGHIEAFREMGGVAHQNWYDNLRSVVIKRSPELKLNAQFLDFARHFGFGSIALTISRNSNARPVSGGSKEIRGFIEPLGRPPSRPYQPEADRLRRKGGKAQTSSRDSLSSLSGDFGLHQQDRLCGV